MRRFGIAALVLAYLQIVFGAIVRITESGMGCGDHWPKCLGSWLPPSNRPDLLIEITHRYIALGLSIAILGLLITAFRARRQPDAAESSVLGYSSVATALVLAAALLGALAVKVELSGWVVALHLTVAMTLLGVLVHVAITARGPVANYTLTGARSRTAIATRAAAVMTFLTIVLGALTANVPGSAGSCVGFPWCRETGAGGGPLHIQVTHRLLAFLLLAHIIGIAIGVRRRHEPRTVVVAAWTALAAAVTQVLIAAAMVEMQFPALLRALHQAAGTFLWIAVVALAVFAERARRAAGV